MSLRWPDFWCVLCHAARPTCPRLRDEVWVAVWARAREAGAPEGREKWRERQLLCLECAERLLGRELDVAADLGDCIGNIAIRTLATRPRPPAGTACTFRTW